MRCALVVLLLLAAPALAGEEDGLEPVRRDFARLLGRTMLWSSPSGPSPTLLVRNLLAHGESRVSAVCARAWRLTQTDGARANARESALEVRDLVHFLHGLGDPRTDDLRLWHGIVVERRAPGGGGSGPANPRAPKSLLFREVVKGRRLVAPDPDAKWLLLTLDRGLPSRWGDHERNSLAMALGETAAAVPEVARGLIERYRKAPGDPALAVAVGWLATPEAFESLWAGLRSMSRNAPTTRVDGWWDACRERSWTIDALQHAGGTELVRRVLALDGGERTMLLKEVSPRHVVPVLLDAIDAASAPEERRRMTDLLLHVFRSDCWGNGRPRSEATARFLSLLLELVESEDETLRESPRRAAANFMYWGWNGGSSMSTGGALGASSWTTEAIGPVPDAETILRRTVEDLRRGRLVLLDDEPDIFDPPGPRPVRSSRGCGVAHSKFGRPRVADADFPVLLEAESVPEGVTLRLRNIGDDPYLINPVLLPSGRAKYCVGWVLRDGKKVPFRHLTVILSFVNLRLGVPASSLIRLDPGDAHAWTVPLRPEHRTLEGLEVSLSDNARILGPVDLPVLANVWPTRVR